MVRIMNRAPDKIDMLLVVLDTTIHVNPWQGKRGAARVKKRMLTLAYCAGFRFCDQANCLILD
jgi:hypothetical protein